MLAYLPGEAPSDGVGRTRSLVWVNLDGEEEALAAPAETYVSLSLSPDGRSAALGVVDESGNLDVWVSELARGTLVRLTTDEAMDAEPLWHPDGRQVAFVSDRSGQPEVFWQAADGSGTAERLLAFDDAVTALNPYDWSPDGATLFVHAALPETGRDVGMVSVEGHGTWEPLIQTAAFEGAPTISPDGRWLAYTSNVTGGNEVYVQRFPQLEGRHAISVGGGFGPIWSDDGRELLYLRQPVPAAPDAVMRMPLDFVEGDPPSLIAGTPERLFDWRYYSAPGASRLYDMSPDGQRFLMITSGTAGDTGVERSEINVVLNWHQELLERVPVN